MFQTRREAADKAREDAMSALRQRHMDYARQLRAWYDAQYLKVREQRLPSSLRRQTYRHLAEKRREDQAERMKREAEERRQLRAAHAIPSWQGHLEALAGG